MNVKYSILTICLTVCALLAPQKAFGLEHQSHKKVHLLCVREAKDRLNCVESKEHKYLGVQKAKGIESSISSVTDAMPALNTNGAVALYNQYGHRHSHEVLITVVWVSSISLWLFLYIKHRNNRAAVLSQNIEALERQWRISNYK
jgi:hypothetical protein